MDCDKDIWAFKQKPGRWKHVHQNCIFILLFSLCCPNLFVIIHFYYIKLIIFRNNDFFYKHTLYLII